MKGGLGIGVAILAAAGKGVRADGVKRRALAEELLTVMNVQASVEQSFATAKEMICRQIRQMIPVCETESAKQAQDRAEKLRE